VWYYEKVKLTTNIMKLPRENGTEKHVLKIYPAHLDNSGIYICLGGDKNMDDYTNFQSKALVIVVSS